MMPTTISNKPSKNEIILSQEQIEEMHSMRWWHSIPLGKDVNGDNVITPGECPHTHTPLDTTYITHRFGMPEDLTGKRVLDIGAWDGLFSFEAEKRGAKVM